MQKSRPYHITCLRAFIVAILLVSGMFTTLVYHPKDAFSAPVPGPLPICTAALIAAAQPCLPPPCGTPAAIGPPAIPCIPAPPAAPPALPTCTAALTNAGTACTPLPPCPPPPALPPPSGCYGPSAHIPTHSLNPGVPTLPPTGGPYISGTCNPNILSAMQARAHAVSQRNAQVAQTLITRPDPTASMVCLGQQFMAAALLIGGIFSDNPAFAGSCSVLGMPGTTIDAIASTMMRVIQLYSLGGGILNIFADLFTDMLTVLASTFFSGLISNFLSSVFAWLGLSPCWTGLAMSLVNGALATLFPRDCRNMNYVWEGVALANINHRIFYTLNQLRNPSNDPRTYYHQRPIPFTHRVAHNLFTQVTGITPTYFHSVGAYAPANLGLNSWAPRSITGTCTTIPLMSGFVSCQKGCHAVEGPPNVYTCVP